MSVSLTRCRVKIERCISRRRISYSYQSRVKLTYFFQPVYLLYAKQLNVKNFNCPTLTKCACLGSSVSLHTTDWCQGINILAQQKQRPPLCQEKQKNLSCTVFAIFSVIFWYHKFCAIDNTACVFHCLKALS